MDAKRYGIGELFQAQARLVIPIYQRPYVWSKDEQWAPLWSDVRRLAEHLVTGLVPKPHFLGAVVVDAHPGPEVFGKVKRHLVIDGQQRLTTLQLLLEALCDNYEHCRDEGCEDADRFAELARLLTRNSHVAAHDVDAEYKVWPMNLDQGAFRSVMNAHSPAHLAEMMAAQPVLKDSRIGEAYVFFYEQVKEWLEAQPDLVAAIEALHNVVDRLLDVVVIDLKNTVDPQIIFETLNARGTPLLASDLIKNYLFHKAAAETGDGDAAYAEYWMPFEDDNVYWSERIGKGAQRRVRINVFMHHYLTMQRRDDVLVTNLYQEYKNFAETSGLSIIDQLAEVRHYGDVYQSLDRLPKNSREATFIYRLRQMDISTIMPFVLRLMGDDSVNADDRVRIMQYLESYVVRRLVCHLTGKAYNKNFVDLLRVSEERGMTPDVVCDLLVGWDKDTNAWPDDDWFRTAWMSYGAYNWMAQARVRMILEALEPVLSSAKAEDIDVNEVLTIEHLMPQSWKEHYPLPEDGSVAEFTRDNMLHTFGNLTLLNKKLNPSVSNGPWIRMVEEEDDNGQLGEVDRGKRAEILRHTRLTMSRMLLDYPAWDEKAIESRGDRLFKAALEVWPRPKTQSAPIIIETEPDEDVLDGESIAQDEEFTELAALENDSVALVPPQGDVDGRDKTDYEKVLVYCPAIASDTLLYYIRQGDSYSLRTYGGRLGVNATGRHAEGAHRAYEFERMYRPERWRDMQHLDLAVGETEKWQKVVSQQWSAYQTARLSS